MKILELKNNIIYGPVNSRRIGRSLGINLLPAGIKQCTFNCAYCQYGWNPDKKNKSLFPAIIEVSDALTAALDELKQTNCLPAYLTFSGNGEPTLHPDFYNIVLEVNKIRRKLSSASKIALLSNSSLLYKPSVQEALKHIDLLIMKFDCGTPHYFNNYNKPQNISFEAVLENLRKISAEFPIYIQTLFADGECGNHSEENINEWINCIKLINPAGVQIYSLSRGFPEKRLKPATPNQLTNIKILLEEAGIPTEIY